MVKGTQITFDFPDINTEFFVDGELVKIKTFWISMVPSYRIRLRGPARIEGQIAGVDLDGEADFNPADLEIEVQPLELTIELCDPDQPIFSNSNFRLVLSTTPGNKAEYNGLEYVSGKGALLVLRSPRRRSPLESE